MSDDPLSGKRDEAEALPAHNPAAQTGSGKRTAALSKKAAAFLIVCLAALLLCAAGFLVRSAHSEPHASAEKSLGVSRYANEMAAEQAGSDEPAEMAGGGVIGGEEQAETTEESLKAEYAAPAAHGIGGSKKGRQQKQTPRRLPGKPAGDLPAAAPVP